MVVQGSPKPLAWVRFLPPVHLLPHMRVPYRRGEAGARPKLNPYLTPAAYDKLKAKLEHLKKVTRFRLMQEVATLAEGGDFSENAGYQIAKGRLRGVNQLILDIEQQLKEAVIIKADISSDIVQVGSTVVVKIDGVEKKYTILGSTEVDPSKYIISSDSPIGQALIGKKVGQKTYIGTPYKKEIEIVKLEATSVQADEA